MDPMELLLEESLAEMNHHRWVKWCLAGVAGKAEEILHLGVLSDLLYGLLVAQAKLLLDEERTKRQPHRLCRGSSGGVELRSRCFFSLVPWHQRGEEHPAVVRIQRAAKRHREICDRELPVMLLPVHRQRGAVVAIIDGPDRGQLIGSRTLKPVAP